MFIFIVIKVLSFSDNKAMNKQQTNNIKNIVGFFRKKKLLDIIVVIMLTMIVEHSLF